MYFTIRLVKRASGMFIAESCCPAGLDNGTARLGIPLRSHMATLPELTIDPPKTSYEGYGQRRGPRRDRRDRGRRRRARRPGGRRRVHAAPERGRRFSM
ncbi:RRXRR domain-containing protein [Microbacterium lacticum]|uniref:RRXRR domain-containing protein n=1 Tax=Microbacterium lacticum TaxID=33885 RepID=UPI0037C97403